MKTYGTKTGYVAPSNVNPATMPGQTPATGPFDPKYIAEKVRTLGSQMQATITPSDVQNIVENIRELLDSAPPGVTTNPVKYEQFIVQAVQQFVNAQNIQQGDVEQIVPIQPMQPAATASRKSFNLKQAHEVDPYYGGGDEIEMQGLQSEKGLAQDQFIQEEPVAFNDSSELRDWLEGKSQDPEDAKNALLDPIGPEEIVEMEGETHNKTDVLGTLLDKYWASDPESSEDRMRIAQAVYDYALAESLKVQQPNDRDTFEMREKVTMQTPNDTIKKIAQDMVNKHKPDSPKSFNLSKTAQHKTLDNAFLWGPGQTKIDPFLRQPVSDWHIIERNKGFGLVVDDVWNIDWENIWRSTIMDKYSRPYRNKSGEWVGGYIQKRFETDKNIPETNNIQLKPGQRRRPYLAEYASTEARLEDMREKDERGYGPQTSGEPFNWKEAQGSKKKVS